MKVVRCHMNCFVLRTFTILSTLRFGRGGFQGLSSTYEQAHVDLDLLILAFYDVGVMPYELFRTSYSHNSTQYSHIVKLTLHFYAHIGAGH